MKRMSRPLVVSCGSLHIGSVGSRPGERPLGRMLPWALVLCGVREARATQILPVVGSLSSPCPSLGRRLARLGSVLIGCLCLGLAPCWSLLGAQHARRLSPSGVPTSRSRTPIPTHCLRSDSSIAPYSRPGLLFSTLGFRDAPINGTPFPTRKSFIPLSLNT
jgi:hypothetical protein